MGLTGKLDQDEIDARVRRITDLVEELTAQRAEDRIGEHIEVLLTEDLSAEEGPGTWAGQPPTRTRTPTGRRPSPGCPPTRRRAARAAEVVDTEGVDLIARALVRRRLRRPGGDRRCDAADPAATPPQTAKLVNLPNALTVLRLAVVPVFAVLLLQDSGHDDAGRYWATLAFGLAIITDRYDGMIARRTGQVTEFGKLADPIADKALTGTALIGLSILGLLPWWVTVVILVREVGVTAAALLGHPARRDRQPAAAGRSRPSSRRWRSRSTSCRSPACWPAPAGG